MNTNRSEFLPLKQTAFQLGVPARWLKSEAEAHRVPCLRAGRRLLFKPDQVSASLARRTMESEVAHV
jgi:hypothetical protein